MSSGGDHIRKLLTDLGGEGFYESFQRAVDVACSNSEGPTRILAVSLPEAAVEFLQQRCLELEDQARLRTDKPLPNITPERLMLYLVQQYLEEAHWG